MDGFTIMHLDDFERPFPKWALARKSLGLESFGMNVVELPPGETIPSTTRQDATRRRCSSPSPAKPSSWSTARSTPLQPARSPVRPGAAADGREPQRHGCPDPDHLGAADERLRADELGLMRTPVTAACVEVEPGDLRPLPHTPTGSPSAPRGSGRRRRRASSSSRRRSCPPTRPPLSGRRRSQAGASRVRRGVRAPASRVARAAEPGCRPAGGDGRDARCLRLAIGVNELDPERPGTLYNSLLYYSPEGELALHHRSSSRHAPRAADASGCS